MDPILTLGSILENEPHRDAIHIAIAPVVALDTVRPGQHISLVNGKATGANADSHLGVVDPFLKAPVKPGQRFWMFLYPNTITSLRHEWIHPAFEAGRISVDDHVAKSQKWIAEHARVLGLSDDVLMENAEEWLRSRDPWGGGYIVQQGSERWRDNFNPTEFWHHYEVVTGKVVAEDKKQSFYCCSC